MSKLSKISTTFFLAFILIAAVGCQNPGSRTGNEPEDKESLALGGVEKPDKDYVYSWSPNNLLYPDKSIAFQTTAYAMTVISNSGSISGMGAIAYDEPYFVEQDMSALPELSVKYGYTDGDSSFFSTYAGSVPQGITSRIAEGGRYVQTVDVPSLRFSDDDLLGSVEVSAKSQYFSLRYGLYAYERSRENVSLQWQMALPEGYDETERHPTLEAVTVKDNTTGKGFTVFALEGGALDVQSGKLIYASDNLTIGRKAHTGTSVLIMPSMNAEPAHAEIMKNLQSIQLSARNIIENTDTPVPITYDTASGVWDISATGLEGHTDVKTEEGRLTYDRIEFSLTNPTGKSQTVVVRFSKRLRFSVTGMSPMIRDKNTLEPTGIQVQISKNWHGNVSQYPESPYMDKGGQWYNGYAEFTVPAGQSVEYEYTCAYGQWGETYAASHAQLCLIGWGGDQLWDQSALGSWGESITYDPLCGLGRAMVDDVRPFLTKWEARSGDEYSWSGNVGGADFLTYETTGRQALKNVKINYKTQAPNMTDVTYSGVTMDGKIAADINIKMGRTDDLVRTYFTLRYEFLEDTEFSRMSFFQVSADKYADIQAKKYAIGNDESVLEFQSMSAGAGYVGGSEQRTVAEGKNPWFYMYDNPSDDQAGNVGIIARGYHAYLNGKNYTKPSYNLIYVNDQSRHIGYSYTVPGEIGRKIQKGSVVEMQLEYVVVPSIASAYYGQSEYLNAQKSNFNDPSIMVLLASANSHTAAVSVGRQTGSYPVQIETDNSSPVVAQFVLSRGLGYTPLVFDGLPSYKNYRLEKRMGDSWQTVDQSKRGNDYWQCNYNPSTGKYQLVFNVKNNVNASLGESGEYRLKKVG